MAQTFGGGGITVVTTGIQLASGAASSSGTIPNDSSGNKPSYIRVAATAPACIKLGKTTATAAAGDMQVQPGDAMILQVPKGYDTIACIQVSAGGFVQISPLENS
jgi:hypothetical protein